MLAVRYRGRSRQPQGPWAEPAGRKRGVTAEPCPRGTLYPRSDTGLLISFQRAQMTPLSLFVAQEMLMLLQTAHLLCDQ